MNEEEFLKAVTDLVADTIDAKLAVKDEQLAEMREAFTPLIEMCHDDPNDAESADWNEVLRRAQKALSAAPKRGRVIAEETVRGQYRLWPLADHSDLMLYAHGFVPHMYISIPHSEVAEKESMAEFTVTVREAE